MTLGELSIYLLFQRPSAGDAGQYRCNIKNDQGETNANLSLNFQQDEEMEEGRQTPRERSATPSRRHKSKSREGTPRRHRSRSRQETPTQEEQKQGGNLQPESVSRRSSKTPEVMEVDQIGKRVRCYRGGVYPLIQLLKERRAIPDFPQHQRRKGVAVEARPLKRKTRPRNLRSSQSSFSHRYFLGSSRLHGLLLYFCKLRGSLPRTLVSSQFASSN